MSAIALPGSKEDWHIAPSGLIVPDTYRPMPTCIDLFCGCGGFSLGAMQAGMRVLAGMDNDAAAAATYMCNLGSYPMQIHFATPEDRERLNRFLEDEMLRQAGVKQRRGKKKKESQERVVLKALTTGSGWIREHPEVPPVEHFFFGDARKFTGQQILDAVGKRRNQVTAVVGGPPCQGFSWSGKRDVMDPRNSLVFEFARLVLEIHPETMVMENVPGIVSMVTPEGLPVVDVFCRILEDGGFGTVDSLRKMLAQTSGAGVAFPSRRKPGRDQEPEDGEQPETGAEAAEEMQLELL